jgi:ribosomal protein S18 acetylase RimI-like enzyme
VIEIRKAVPEDAEILTNIARRTFLHDNELKPASASPEGPPGHDSIEAQRQWIESCLYYKALYKGQIVGGGMAWMENPEIFHIDGMYVDPDFQGLGIGSALVAHILKSHAPGKKWVLETPSFSARNHHFYEKFGFIRTKEIPNDLGWSDIYYEKIIL